MAINTRGPLDHITRGGDILTHRVMLYAVNIGRIAGIALAVGGVVSMLCMLIFLSSTTREIFFSYNVARIFDLLGMAKKLVSVDIDTQILKLPAREVLANLRVHYDLASIKFYACFIPGLVVSGVLGKFLHGKFSEHGEEEGKDVFLRGQKRVEPEELIKRISETSKVSPFAWGTIPVPYPLVYRNFLAVGSMGVGKSQAFYPMMKELRQQGVKTLVYDVSGEFAAAFYRPGIDHILNPLDARCAAWNMSEDVIDSNDTALIASAFLPQNPNAGQNKFFEDAARVFLEDMIMIAKREGLSMGEMYRVISSDTSPDPQAEDQTDELVKEIKAHGGKSALLMSGKSDAIHNVRSELIANPALRNLNYFPRSGTPFSIRKWIDEPGDSWLFLTSRESAHESIRPFITVFLSIAFAQAMETPVDQTLTDEREKLKRAFMLDELESAGKVEKLQDITTRGRKYGNFLAIGCQSYAQIQERYGEKIAQTMLGNLQNKLVLRCEEGETAKHMSELLGKTELDETKQSTSFGAEASRDSASVSRERKDIYVVHPSELTTLPDLTGFVKIAGDYPVAKVTYKPVPIPRNEPMFLKADGLEFVYELPGKRRSNTSTTDDDEATGGGIELDDELIPDTALEQEIDDADIPDNAYQQRDEVQSPPPERVW